KIWKSDSKPNGVLGSNGGRSRKKIKRRYRIRPDFVSALLESEPVESAHIPPTRLHQGHRDGAGGSCDETATRPFGIWPPDRQTPDRTRADRTLDPPTLPQSCPATSPARQSGLS